MRKRSWRRRRRARARTAAPPPAAPAAGRAVAERGAQQLVQCRERQLGLRLHPARAQHVHVGRARARVVEQDGLADARLAAQRERAAPRAAGRVEQCADEGALSVPPKQHRPTLPTDVATI